MQAAHMVYLAVRNQCKSRIESQLKDSPPWLQAFYAEVQSVQNSASFQYLLKDLRPWEVENEARRLSPEEKAERDADDLDPRWKGDRANKRANRVAMTIRERILSKPWWEAIVLLAILCVAGVTGHELETEKETNVEAAIDHAAIAVFTLEMILKVLSEGDTPLQYLLDPEYGIFNAFDCALVLGSYTQIIMTANGEALHEYAVFRIIKLARLLSLINTFRELRLIVVGLVQGFKSSLYIMLLLLLVVYMAGVLSVRLFAENDPGNFGSLPIAMITLFQVSTVTTWSPLAYTAIYGCDTYSGAGYDLSPLAVESNRTFDDDTVGTLGGTFRTWKCDNPQQYAGFTEVFYIFFTIITALIIMSLFIGAITMSMFEAFQEEENVKHFRNYEVALEHMDEVFQPDSVLAKCIAAALCDEPAPPTTILWSGKLCSSDFTAWIIWAYTVEQSAAFQNFITATIITVSVVIGIETDYGESEATKLINYVALWVFTVEVLVKVTAQGVTPGVGAVDAFKKYWTDPWNKFDFLIVVVSLVELLPVFELSGLMILRLFRMLRIFKAARALPRLRAIIDALGGGLSSSCWVVVLMAILNYILACIGMMEFKANDPFHFGTLMSAIFSVWRIETGDSWDQILRINMYGCATFPLGYPMVGDLPKGELDERDIKIAGEDPDLQCTDEVAMGYYAALYIIFTVIFGGLVLPSLLVGIIAISFEDAWARFSTELTVNKMLDVLIDDVSEQLPNWWSKERLLLIRRIFAMLDISGKGYLDIKEADYCLGYIIRNHLMQPWAKSHGQRDKNRHEKSPGVLRGEEVKDLFMTLDSSGDAMLNLVEFVSFIIVTKKVATSLEREAEANPGVDPTQKITKAINRPDKAVVNAKKARSPTKKLKTTLADEIAGVQQELVELRETAKLLRQKHQEHKEARLAARQRAIIAKKKRDARAAKLAAQKEAEEAAEQAKAEARKREIALANKELESAKRWREENNLRRLAEMLEKEDEEADKEREIERDAQKDVEEIEKAYSNGGSEFETDRNLGLLDNEVEKEEGEVVEQSAQADVKDNLTQDHETLAAIKMQANDSNEGSEFETDRNIESLDNEVEKEEEEEIEQSTQADVKDNLTQDHETLAAIKMQANDSNEGSEFETDRNIESLDNEVEKEEEEEIEQSTQADVKDNLTQDHETLAAIKMQAHIRGSIIRKEKISKDAPRKVKMDEDEKISNEMSPPDIRILETVVETAPAISVASTIRSNDAAPIPVLKDTKTPKMPIDVNGEGKGHANVSGRTAGSGDLGTRL